MHIDINLSDHIYGILSAYAKREDRSLAEQIEHWSVVGKIAEENADLPYAFIQDILAAKKEVERGEVSEFIFDDIQ